MAILFETTGFVPQNTIVLAFFKIASHFVGASVGSIEPVMCGMITVAAPYE